jgi:hypothetical protein
MSLAVVAMVVMWVSALVPWGFAIMYHWVSGGQWRHDPMGWHIMAITVVDGLIFAMLVVASLIPLLGQRTWYQWLYLLVVAGIPVVTVWRGLILWRLYHPKEAE